jgi:hypothetical protein
MLKQNYRLEFVIALVTLMVFATLPAVHTAQAQVQPHLQSGDWRCVEINGTLALNIRSGPGVDYDLVMTRAAGEQMDANYAAVTAADGYNWLPVRPSNGDEGGAGWAITVRLSPCPAADTGKDTGTETGTDASSGAETDTGDVPGSTSPNYVLEGVNQDGTLDHVEIEQVARSVVLIANVRGSRIRATGTGTITTPDGLIVTNAHVVEDADRVAVGILDDINDPPEYLYLGEIVRVDEEIDVALIAIRYDMDERPVDAASLNLPYIPSTLKPGDVFRGDSIYIFGYPGIGDDFLVVTTGSIVSVENGDLNGQRLPVWYRTDAEIAPGNSGGLAVIPTFVQTEDETGGRLGGIRPAEVALMAVLDEEYGPLAAAATDNERDDSVDPGVKPEGVAPGAEFILRDVRLDHGAVQDDQTGIAFHIAFTIIDWQDRDAALSARVFHDDLAGSPVINPDAPAQYRDTEGVVMVSAPLLPCCETTVYDDVPLFLPYDALGFTAEGAYPLKIEIAVTAGDGSWRRVLVWEFVTYTRG